MSFGRSLSANALTLNIPQVQDIVNGTVVLITGGTGSFGKKLTTTLLGLDYGPKSIIIFSRDEFKQHAMLTSGNFSDSRIKYVIGDVRNYDRVYETLIRYNVDIVIHTAAIKHVDFAEKNPSECISTNITGTENVVKACINSKIVTRALALSTDKCVDPINIYGASKLCLERLVITGNNFDELSDCYRDPANPSVPTSCIFAVARYGNVLGSRGSVVGVFDQQIKKGQIRITDGNMTRFTLMKREAVAFALNCLAYMIGGEVFVPILPSYTISQLADVMDGDRNTPRVITGLRAGEKVAESMISCHESHLAFHVHEVPCDADYESTGFYVVTHHYYGSMVNYDQAYFHRFYDKECYGTTHRCKKNWSYSSDKNHFMANEDLKKCVDEVLAEEV